MQAAFGTVLWIVCGLGIVAALFALITSGSTWEEYGKRGLVLERDFARGPGHGSASATVERDAEIRQLLEARNARRVRRGETPIDVEYEFQRLTAIAGMDEGLRAEIREFVVARNHRRARAGKAPLDVDAEVEREITRLGSPGIEPPL